MANIWSIIISVYYPTIFAAELSLENKFVSVSWWWVCSTLTFICICRCCFVQSRHVLSLTISDLKERHQLFVERRAHQNIMRSLMPSLVAEHVLLTGQTPLYSKHVTVGFIKMSFFYARSLNSALEANKVEDTHSIIKLLHRAIIQFDTKIEQWEPLVTKIEHVQNCYLICGGILTPQRKRHHAEAVIRVCLEFKKSINEINHKSKVTCVTTMGIHSGPVIGTIIGTSRKFFRIFGDTVNTASRVCTTGISGEIQISTATHQEGNVASTFDLTARTPVYMKGKGNVKTYVVHQVRNLGHVHAASRMPSVQSIRTKSLSRHTMPSMSAKTIETVESTNSQRVLPNVHWRNAELEDIEQNKNELLSMNFYKFLNTAQAQANKFTLKFPTDNSNISQDMKSVSQIVSTKNQTISNSNNKIGFAVKSFLGTSSLRNAVAKAKPQNSLPTFKQSEEYATKVIDITKQTTSTTMHDINSSTEMKNQSTSSFESKFVEMMTQKNSTSTMLLRHCRRYIAMHCLINLTLHTNILHTIQKKPSYFQQSSAIQTIITVFVYIIAFSWPLLTILILQILYVKKILITKLEIVNFTNYCFLVLRFLAMIKAFNLTASQGSVSQFDLLSTGIILLGFFDSVFRFYQIVPMSFVTIVIFAYFHLSDHANEISASMHFIEIEIFILLIGVAIKYRNEKHERKNLIYQMAIEFSRVDRDEATSILIPHFIAKMLMNSETSLSQTRLLSRKFNKATVFQSDIVGMYIQLILFVLLWHVYIYLVAHM